MTVKIINNPEQEKFIKITLNVTLIRWKGIDNNKQRTNYFLPP